MDLEFEEEPPRTYPMTFQSPDGPIVGTFTATELPDGNQRLELSLADRHVVSTATDCFEALCNIRREIEKDAILPICYGASLHCYPSGMCRDMGRGYVVYKLSAGVHGRMADLVPIFDTGPDVVPATVQQQQDNYGEWLRSIGVRTE